MFINMTQLCEHLKIANSPHKNRDCARFALVLDTSGSMKDHRRLDRVKQSASDWINFDVQNGSSVAIVTFA